MDFGKIKNLALLWGGAGLVVWYLAKQNESVISDAAGKLYTQATSEDVLRGNQARSQLGGFQYPSYVPGREAMYAAERGSNVPGGKPAPMPSSRHARAVHGRRS